jgi:IMP dehydrogenase
MFESMHECKGDTFNDVMFVPQYSEEFRGNIITTTDMGSFSLELPLISANMKDITGPKMAAKIASMGGLGILHRFGNIEQNIEDCLKTVLLLEQNPPINRDKKYWFGVSVGVKEYEKERFIALHRLNLTNIYVIDVAHGHHVLVKNMIEFMRGVAGKEICIIAGNIATVEAAKDLISWGANIIKVGIGPGNACMTRRNTGVGVPQLKAIREIRKKIPDCYIISDGGIKYSGDIPKALKYANAVMVGSLIAGTSETPGMVYENENGEHYKVYGGSASGERKVESGGNNSFVEGVVKIVKFQGKVKYILKKAKESLQSCMSYCGSHDLDEFREKAILVDIGSGAKSESKL